MPAPEPRLDDTPDPRAEDLSRRSRTPSVAAWIIVILILMAGAFAYAISAVL